MDDFVHYLREWQERNGVQLVQYDGKCAEAHNASNSLQVGDPSYISPKVSPFAYKSWMCVRGKKSRSKMEGKEGNQKRESDILMRLCGFRVRARYVPPLKKVKCSVKWHDGPDALPSGHNHALEKGRKKRADNEARVLTLLKERSEEAVSLVSSWRVDQRRRFCESLLQDAAVFLSNPDSCSVRRMLEILSIVNFLASPLSPRSPGVSARSESHADDGQVSEIEAQNDTEVVLSLRKEKGRRQRAVKFVQDATDVVSEQHTKAKSRDASPVKKEAINEDKMRFESDHSSRSSYITDSGASAIERMLVSGKDTCLSLAAILRFSSESSNSLGDLIRKVNRFPKRVSQSNFRTMAVKAVTELEADEKPTPSKDVLFLLEIEGLERLVRRVEKFRRGRTGTKSVASRQTGEGTLTIADDDEKDLQSYVACIKLGLSVDHGGASKNSREHVLSLQTLLDMRKVCDLKELFEEGQRFLEWVDALSPGTNFGAVEELNLYRSKVYVKDTLGSLAPADWQCDNGNRGFAYHLRSLFRFRGSSGVTMGRWLDSDAIQMCLLSTEKTLSVCLRKFVFLLPPFQWEAGYSRRLGLRLRSSNTGCSGPKSGICGTQAERYVDLLRKQKDPIISAGPLNLAFSVVYAVINKDGSHWLALEVCTRTKRVLVYDPALSKASAGGEDPTQYFVRVRNVLELLFKDQKAPVEERLEWQCAFADGGQQKIETDPSNCGIYAIEWIKFRIEAAVERRRWMEEKELASHYSEKGLRETKMAPMKVKEIDACRLRNAHSALVEIKRLQKKE